MPDLDQLLDSLVDDVRLKTRVPGASTAIKQARRRRNVLTAAGAVAAGAIIAVGGGLAAGTLGGSEGLSPIGEPATPPPDSYEGLATELEAIVVAVPGWNINESNRLPDYDYAFNGPCSGDWGKGATSGHDGGLPARFGDGRAGFPSEAQASDAAAKFVKNLESCTTTAWRTQPIAQTGAVLASSADGVAWIQQKGAYVEILQVPTTDGPPPMAVQVEVAEWIVAYMMTQID